MIWPGALFRFADGDCCAPLRGVNGAKISRSSTNHHYNAWLVLGIQVSCKRLFFWSEFLPMKPQISSTIAVAVIRLGIDFFVGGLS